MKLLIAKIVKTGYPYQPGTAMQDRVSFPADAVGQQITVELIECVAAFEIQLDAPA